MKIALVHCIQTAEDIVKPLFFARSI